MRIVLAGGGSAGHVNPLLATAAEIRRRDPDATIHVLGTSSGLESELVPAAGFPLSFIPRARLPRRPSPEWLALPLRLRQADSRAGAVIDEVRPDAVVGFGGYVSTPAFRAAVARRIPVVVHEANARPGLANRYGARHARVVALSFPSIPLIARRGETVVTGLPLREGVAELVELRASGRGHFARQEGARALGLDPDLPTLLISGGSLGALSINTAASGAIAELAARGQVLHLTGKGKDAPVREAWRAAGEPETYRIREYLSEMEQAYAVADVVLTRAGAGMVSELSALGIAGIYVPLPVGNGEQRLNAAHVIDARGGILIEDKKLSSAVVRDRIGGLLANIESAHEMGRRAAGVAPHDGARRLVDAVEGVLA